MKLSRKFPPNLPRVLAPPNPPEPPDPPDPLDQQSTLFASKGSSGNEICKSFGNWEDEFNDSLHYPIVECLWNLTMLRSKLNEDSQSSPQLLFQEVLPGFAGLIMLLLLTDMDVLIISLVLGMDLNEIAGFLLYVQSLVILLFSIYRYFTFTLCVAILLAMLFKFLCCISLFSTIGVEFRRLLYASSGLSVSFAPMFYMLALRFAVVASDFLFLASLACIL
ncbi:unnamed protein product [Thlaspi arvense]|uniref:Uncharacterized protein n=1 Tax=Thlaspi arvense TaxID=13288 RepID=A0AAU9S6F9_THLAR|nr:unnamed protein product [Thlaspi arvense]